MRHLHSLILSVALLPLLSACQGAVGATGETGPQGEQGPAGETGPMGEDGENGTVNVANVDGLVEALVADPEFRRLVVAELAENYADELRGEPGRDGAEGPQGERGPQGEQGPAGEDGEDGGGTERAGVCRLNCEVDSDCGPSLDIACRNGGCVPVGCESDEQCIAEGWSCVMR